MTALLYNNWRLCLPHLPQPLLNDWMRKVFLLLEISKPYSQDLMLSLKCSHCTFINSKFCLIWESEYDQRRQRILSGGEIQGRTLISVINFFSLAWGASYCKPTAFWHRSKVMEQRQFHWPFVTPSNEASTEDYRTLQGCCKLHCVICCRQEKRWN